MGGSLVCSSLNARQSCIHLGICGTSLVSLTESSTPSSFFLLLASIGCSDGDLHGEMRRNRAASFCECSLAFAPRNSATPDFTVRVWLSLRSSVGG